jgi:mono/diheme cytochrome c family protein
MARAVLVLVLVTLASALLAGCGEDLDTGEAVPPATEVVTDTTGEETTTDEETTTGGEPTGGDVAAGEGVFASAGCGGCHTLEAAGTTGTVGPNLDEVMPSVDQAVTVVTSGRGAMPAFEGQLSEEEIRNVAAFVAESAGG